MSTRINKVKFTSCVTEIKRMISEDRK